MFTVYSEAVQGFFRRLKWLGRPVPVVYAGPDRAHGQMKKYLASRMGSSTGKKIEELIKEIDEAKIPRPFISVFMTLAGYDASRFTPFVHRGIAIDVEEGTALSVQAPRPENITVQADMWAGDDWHCGDSLAFQLKSMFNADDTPLFVDFTDPAFYLPPYQIPEFCKLMGKITCRLTDGGINDTSQYTGARGVPKEVRQTFSGNLEGWLPRMPYKGELVRSMEFQVQATDGETVETLDGFTINLPE